MFYTLPPMNPAHPQQQQHAPQYPLIPPHVQLQQPPLLHQQQQLPSYSRPSESAPTKPPKKQSASAAAKAARIPRKKSCLRCRTKKIKCLGMENGETVCSGCISVGEECSGPLARKKQVMTKPRKARTVLAKTGEENQHQDRVNGHHPMGSMNVMGGRAEQGYSFGHEYSPLPPNSDPYSHLHAPQHHAHAQPHPPYLSAPASASYRYPPMHSYSPQPQPNYGSVDTPRIRRNAVDEDWKLRGEENYNPSSLGLRLPGPTTGPAIVSGGSEGMVGRCALHTAILTSLLPPTSPSHSHAPPHPLSDSSLSLLELGPRREMTSRSLVESVVRTAEEGRNEIFAVSNWENLICAILVGEGLLKTSPGHPVLPQLVPVLHHHREMLLEDERLGLKDSEWMKEEVDWDILILDAAISSQRGVPCSLTDATIQSSYNHSSTRTIDSINCLQHFAHQPELAELDDVKSWQLNLTLTILRGAVSVNLQAPSSPLAETLSSFACLWETIDLLLPFTHLPLTSSSASEKTQFYLSGIVSLILLMESHLTLAAMRVCRYLSSLEGGVDPEVLVALQRTSYWRLVKAVKAVEDSLNRKEFVSLAERHWLSWALTSLEIVPDWTQIIVDAAVQASHSSEQPQSPQGGGYLAGLGLTWDTIEGLKHRLGPTSFIFTSCTDQLMNLERALATGDLTAVLGGGGGGMYGAMNGGVNASPPRSPSARSTGSNVAHSTNTLPLSAGPTGARFPLPLAAPIPSSPMNHLHSATQLLESQQHSSSSTPIPSPAIPSHNQAPRFPSPSHSHSYATPPQPTAPHLPESATSSTSSSSSKSGSATSSVAGGGSRASQNSNSGENSAQSKSKADIAKEIVDKAFEEISRSVLWSHNSQPGKVEDGQSQGQREMEMRGGEADEEGEIEIADTGASSAN